MLEGLCEEKFRLLTEFRKATQAYSSVVGDMAKAVIGLPREEFLFLRAKSQQEHEALLIARERFYQHMQEHGCG